MVSKVLAALTETQLRAVVEVVALVAYADGSLARAEVEMLEERLAELPGGTLEASALEALIAELRPPRRPASKARAERLKKLGEFLGDETLRLKAFEIAAAVAQADGRVGVREAASLAAAAAELGLDAHAALGLLEAATQATRG